MPPKPCDLPCPKCGSSDISRRHQPCGTIIAVSFPDSRRLVPSSEFISRKNPNAHLVLKECLTNMCRCCWYEWDSDILAPKTKKARTK